MQKIKPKANSKTKKVLKASRKKITKTKKKKILVASRKQQKKYQEKADEFSIVPKDLVSLPAIDLNDSENKIVPAIMTMLTDIGFLHLKNVSGFDEDKLLADVK